MTDRLHADEWEVRPIADLSIGHALVKRYHYAAGASNTATYAHGLFRKGSFWECECMGVAWWIPPTRKAAEATYPARWQGVLSLSRLVIVPGVPKNACTFLLARSRKLIDRELWPCLVTYADEWRGHTGAIYRADNWQYLGKTRPEAVYTLNGRMIARKAGPRTRTKAEMLAMGAVLVGRFAKHKYVRFA
jgi:hypothetical protein